MKINKLSVIVLSVLTLSCGDNKMSASRVDELPYFDEASFTPKWLETGEITNTFHQIPSFALIDQSGDTITDQNLNDKVTVVNFFFTSCPGICPKMTDNMKLVQEAFDQDNDIQIFSHSVTPDYDSVSVLKKYAERNDIHSEKWHLLTGERTMIYNLGRNQYFIEEDLGLDKDPDDFIHTENFVLVDQNRRIRGIYNGLNKSSVRQLIADAKTLL